MQDIQITAQDLIDDLNTQVSNQTQELTYARAEKTALIRRIEELEQIVAQQSNDINSLNEELGDLRSELNNVSEATLIIDGETE